MAMRTWFDLFDKVLSDSVAGSLLPSITEDVNTNFRFNDATHGGVWELDEEATYQTIKDFLLQVGVWVCGGVCVWC